VADYRVIAPNYFRAMKIPLVRGRHLTEDDREGTPGAVVINETMARFWPHEDPIGKQIRLKFPEAKPPWRPEAHQAHPSWLTIVGIVGNVRDAGRDPEVVPEVYMSYRQSPSHFMRLVVRTSSEPMSFSSAVRHELLALDKDQPVMDIKTVEQFISESSFRRRFDTVLLGTFAALALSMSGVGIFGVISYSISQRKHEIGVRMALGAKPRDVLRLVVRQGMVLTLIGVLAGLAGAVGVTRVLSSLLYAVRSIDPLTYLVSHCCWPAWHSWRAMSPRAGRRRSIPSWRCAANSAGFPETSQPKDFCLPETRPIILYDGVCGLCNRFNQFVLKRDRKDLFRFAPLQSSFASGVLMRHGAEPRKLDTVYVVVDYDQPTERLLSKSHAILFALQQIGGTWRMVSAFRCPQDLFSTLATS
jgi:predicted DCC family thiol-disulfide oxidoreductase YuxK